MSERDPAHPSPDAERSTQERLAEMERAVARLTSEMAALRAELGAARGTAVPAPRQPDLAAQREEALRERLLRPPLPPGLASPGAPAAPSPRGAARDALAHRIRSTDVEGLVGRYGTLVLATILGLAAVGTFLGWAIARGMLGPEVRVVLGLVAAAALAAGGYRLRRRERSFGSTLMGLALAVVHVCAWSAGPQLLLVPPSVAFSIAAAASAALAAFAHRENDEPLWCAGFGGAAIAPFVTSTGSGNAMLLAAYGVAVLVAGGYALRERLWGVAQRVFLLGAALFTGALMSMPERELAPIAAMAFPLAVTLAGVIPFAGGAALRARVRALGVMMLAATMRAAVGTGFPISHAALAAIVAGTGAAWLVLADGIARAPGDGLLLAPPGMRPHAGAWLESAWLPIGFAAMIPVALDARWQASSLVLGAAAVAIGVALARRGAGAGRDALAVAASAIALAAAIVAGAGADAPNGATAGVAALAVAMLGAGALWPSRSWLVMAAGSLLGAALMALALVTDRVPFEYAPFGTRESAAAVVVLAAIVAARAVLARTRAARGESEATAKLIDDRARIAPWIYGFLWVHQELMWAVSPTVAMLLRITYYAATSAASVGVGRARGSAALRHIGLALALVAAATTLSGARGLDSIVARIGAYLVASVFLMAIAYWYRRPGAEPSEPEKGVEPPPAVAPHTPTSEPAERIPG